MKLNGIFSAAIRGQKPNSVLFFKDGQRTHVLNQRRSYWKKEADVHQRRWTEDSFTLAALTKLEQRVLGVPPCPE
jgi:hypothetical protein